MLPKTGPGDIVPKGRVIFRDTASTIAAGHLTIGTLVWMADAMHLRAPAAGPFSGSPEWRNIHERDEERLPRSARAARFRDGGERACGRPATTAAEHPRLHGRRCRLVQYRRLPSGDHVGEDPEPRQARVRRHLFTDYYAEASCTAGRANFITGELPIRTGLTTVGQAGADVGIPDQAATLASALKAQGYATGQFGKNHLGDLNKYLPTLHGFDEFFGYLYHLDAISDPYWFSFPVDQDFYNKYGPRSLIHSFATETDYAIALTFLEGSTDAVTSVRA
jgi:Sulfatase